MITDEKRLQELLSRGVEEVFVRENLERALRSGKPLTVKLGIDPTGPKIHLGRAVVLWKLRAFQELGHKVVLVVGDFTAQIGDPSDKLEKRPMLSALDVKKNMAAYKKQIGKVLDLRKVKFVHNSKWLAKLTLREISELAESFSVLQMSNRRNFKDRLDKGEEVSLREFLYPLMQGYDSVKIQADVELGGFDQLFNLKAGRTIQRHFGMKEQDIVATAMLEGTDGRKMSTSWGNVINIDDEAPDMFGKIMSVRDELISKYFTLATCVPAEEIAAAEKGIKEGANPRDAKMRLAEEIVALYHGKEKALAAKENFIKTFSKKEVPREVQEIKIDGRNTKFSDILVSSKLISSKSEFSRLLNGGALHWSFDNVNWKKIDRDAAVDDTCTVRIGKHRFLKINVK